MTEPLLKDRPEPGPAETGGDSLSGVLFPALILFLIAFAYFLTFYFSDTSFILPSAEDLGELWPHQRMAKDMWAKGMIPLWTCQISCGFPLGVWAHIFHPLEWIFRVWDYSFASLVNLCVHLFIFSLGTQYMLTALSIRKRAALLASILITYGPILGFWYWHFIPTILTAAWTPWVYAFAFRLFQSQRFSNLLGMTFSFSMQVAGLRPDLTLPSIFLMGIIALVLVFYRPRKAIPSAWLWFTGGLIGTMGIFLFQIEGWHHNVRSYTLSFDYWLIHQRDPATFSLLLLWILTPSAIVTLRGVYASRRKGLVLSALIFVILCVLLIFSPDFIQKIKYQVPVIRSLLWPNVTVILACLGLAILIGEGYSCLELKTLSPKILMRLSAFLLFFAVAYGFMFLLSRIFKPGESELGMYLSGLVKGKAVSAVGLLALAWLLATLALIRQRSHDKTLGAGWAGIFFALIITADVLFTVFVGSMRLPHKDMPRSPLARRWNSEEYMPYRTLHIFPWPKWRKVKIPIQVGSDPHTRGIDAYISIPFRRYANVLTVLDPNIMEVSDNQLLIERFMSRLKEDHFITPDAIEILNFLNVGNICVEKTNLKFGSVYHLRWQDPKSLLFTGNWPEKDDAPVWRQKGAGTWREHAAAIPGFTFITEIEVSSRQPAAINVIIDDQNPQDRRLVYARILPGREKGGPQRLMVRAPLPEVKAPLYSLVGAALVPPESKADIGWLDPKLSNPERPFKFVFQDGDIDVFTNPAALPRAFIVHKARVIESDEERLKYMSENPRRLRTEAVLDEPLPHEIKPADPARESLKMLRYQDQEIVFQAVLDAPGLVVTSEILYPGWKAYDSQENEIKIHYVNHAFRGVYLPKGRHRVRMVYIPNSFRVGLWVSIGSMAATLFFIGGFVLGRFKRP